LRISTEPTPILTQKIPRDSSYTNRTSQVWADVFATALEGKDLKAILAGFAAAGPAPAAASGAAAASGSTEAAAEEAEEEAAEESDDDMGFGLFD
jgi:large subunit ribosomal protein LP1